MAKVERIVTLPVSAAQVWELIADFGSIDQWMPGIDRLELRGGEANTPGVERVIESGGNLFIERLTAINDAEMQTSYTMPAPPFPISDHQATLALTATSDNQCTVTWTATFKAAQDVVPVVADAMGGAFAFGLSALAQRFGGEPAAESFTAKTVPRS